MRPHITQPNYLIAEVALGCAGAVCKLVRREAAEENVGVREGWVIRSFLWYNEVAKLAKYFFAWTQGCSVVSKIGKVHGKEVAVRAWYGGWWMKDGVVSRFGR
jgi:hypothetical protein